MPERFQFGGERSQEGFGLDGDVLLVAHDVGHGGSHAGRHGVQQDDLLGIKLPGLAQGLEGAFSGMLAAHGQKDTFVTHVDSLHKIRDGPCGH